MIKNIKIYGERNSGTNFLYQLIEQNIKNIKLHSPYYKSETGWKHSYPRLNLFNDKINSTLFIFIIRDLRPWLISMYKTPYHLKKINNKDLFLINKIKANEERKDHDVNIIKKETNINIFELRYNKIKSYIDTFDNVKNAIFINLEDIQIDYGKKFINLISNKFKLSKTQKFNIILRHTKTKEKKQNNKNKIIFKDNIIHQKINLKFENFNKLLKINYLIKSNL